MPITLIKNTKDNAMHGSDNDRYTGCRMKMQGGSWYTREGELKDITDLTCDRCKEVFATKMIRESNREESRLAKEEKKRYQKAKKQGIVREATYEEYLMNRESEASAKRDSRNDEETSASLHMLKDAIPQSAPVQQPSAPVQFQSPFNPYNQQQPQQQIVPPQNMFNPYAQQPQQQIVPPQNIFNPYAAQQPVSQNVQDNLNQGDTAQFSVPQFNAQPSAPAAVQPEPVQQPAEAADDGPAPSYQEYVRGSFGTESSSASTNNSNKPGIAADDDFLSQFMINKTPEPVQEAPAPESSVTANNILNATDDILSQFNIGAKIAETPVPASNEVKADASSFYSDNIPVVGAEYAGASSVNSATTEFGSLNIVEPPKDEFVVPNVPVYQPSGNGYANANMASQSSSLDELTVPDVSSLKPASSASNYSMQFSELASADVHQSVPSDDIDEVGLADMEPDFGFGQLTSNNSYEAPASSGDAIDIMSGFGDVSTEPVSDGFGSVQPAAPTMNSFESVQPVQPTAPTMNSFESVQPAAPTMNSFESVQPVQPAAPTMNSFESVQPVQPTAPTMNSFESVQPVQPAAPTMNSFESVQPVQPTAPTMNSFESVQPVQPAAPTMNSFESVQPVQPAAPTMNSFGAAQPVQPAAPTMNSFGAAQPTMNGFGNVPPVQQVSPAMNGFNQPVQNNPYAQPQAKSFNQPMYQQPGNNMGAYNSYAAPQGNSFQMPQQQNSFASQPAAAPAPARKAPSPAVFEQGNTADSIEEALRQLGLDVASPEEKAQTEKEEIVPDFVSYVPSSSKVLHVAPPSASAANNNAQKRPMTAKEAKQLAKIDAKFKKDLISRGFNPNELKSQRRGK